MDQVVDTASFRYPKPTDEDLPALSRLAYRLSATQCKDCRNYHVMWPYLRSIGANGGGPEFDWEAQVKTVAAAASGRSHVRWILAGSADAGKLALVAAAMRNAPGATFDVTIVDRCPTPLALCRAHAEANGLNVTTILGELQDFAADQPFDAAIMHHTLVFIPAAKRAAFLKHAAGWLAPGGRLILSLSFDRPNHAPPPRPNLTVAAWREHKIREAVASGELELPESMEDFLARLLAMRDQSRGGSVERHLREDYLADIAGAGFTLEKVEPLLPIAHAALAKEWGQRDRFMLVASRSPA